MKNYLIFAISFIILVLVFQMFSGYILNFFFVPNTTDAWNQVSELSDSIVIKGSPIFIQSFFIFLAGTLAYFTPKIFNRSEKHRNEK